jgi:hypothetical protein
LQPLVWLNSSFLEHSRNSLSRFFIRRGFPGVYQFHRKM